MKKKLLSVALVAMMTVSTALSAIAATTISEDQVFEEGAYVADGTTAWASGATGLVFPVDEDGVTVTWQNDGFTKNTNNWDNFIIETIATADAAGFTARADAWAWTYGDNTTNVPTFVASYSWRNSTNGWAYFQTLTDDAEVSVNAKKTGDNTVEYLITFAEDATAWEKYVVTYPAGVPSDLTFQVGADGGKVTLKSVAFGVDTDKSVDTIGGQANGDGDKLAFVSTVDKDLIDNGEVEELGVILTKSEGTTVTLEDVDGTDVVKCPTSYVTSDTAAGADDNNYAFRTIVNYGEDIEASTVYTAVTYMILTDGTVVYGSSASRAVGYATNLPVVE